MANAALDAADALVESQLRSGQTVRFTIRTGSMRPMLQPGDALTVRRSDLRALRIGDILLARTETGWRVHRLIGERRSPAGPYLVTKGDGAAWPDPPWPTSELRGAVIAVNRRGQEVNLRSGIARLAGAAVARLSRSEAMARRESPSAVRRLVCRALRRAVRVAASSAARVAGLDQ